MTRQDFTKEQVNQFVERYECFEDTNKQKFLYLKEQYKNNNFDNLPSKIRVPSSYETLEMKEYEDGSIRSLEQVIMNGSDVFSFAISELPKDIKRLLQYAGKTIDDVDKYAFHQANNFMTNYIAKKSKANPEKILHSIQKYGNTSSTSVPLTIVSELADKLKGSHRVMMCGFGAGLSWGTALLLMKDCQISPVIEY